MDGDVAYTLLYYPHNIDELLELGVGDPRWSGSTPLIGAIMSGQPSIVQYLVDRGATSNVKTTLGWTPLQRGGGRVLLQREEGVPAGRGDHPQGDGRVALARRRGVLRRPLRPRVAGRRLDRNRPLQREAGTTPGRGGGAGM